MRRAAFLWSLASTVAACSNPSAAPLTCPSAYPPAPAAASFAPPPSAAAQPSPSLALSVVVPSAVAAEPGRLFDEGLAEFLPRAACSEVGVDCARLDELVRAAEASNSDALLLIKDGRLLAERYFGTRQAPIETMSITKSVVALAIGMLLAEGKIASLDAPVSTWYPQWKEGKRGRVTLRHLMTHTAGLERKKGAPALNSSTDRLKTSLQARVAEEPGKAFAYSNEGSQLLSGIIRSAAGQPADAYLQQRLFKPLGIRGWQWDKDQHGNVQTYYGLALSARDLARIGLLMLADGTLEGKAVLPAGWVQQATSPAIPAAPGYGLLWWLRFDAPMRLHTQENNDALRAAGFAGAELLRPLLDKAFAAEEGFFLEAGALLDAGQRALLLEARRKGVPLLASRPGPQLGYSADGWLGQKLGVYPSLQVVAVRQHRRRDGTEQENATSGFGGFYQMLEAACR